MQYRLAVIDVGSKKLMYKLLKLSLCLVMLLSLSGCSGIMQYLEKLQAQPADNLAARSQSFKPVYQLQAPKRENLAPETLRRVGSPPPQFGRIILNGQRYYSANGYICQHFKEPNAKTGAASSVACYINGQWVRAASVLNTGTP